MAAFSEEINFQKGAEDAVWGVWEFGGDRWIPESE